MKVLVNKAVTFVEEMQKQIESTSGRERKFKQPKSLVGGKYVRWDILPGDGIE